MAGYGHAAVVFALGMLKRDGLSGQLAKDIIAVAATEESVHVIGEAIASNTIPKIVLGPVIDVAARIATSAMLPYLCEYVASGGVEEQQHRALMAIGPVCAGLQRASSQQERAEWQEVYYGLISMSGLDEERLAALALSYHPDILALRRIKKLFMDGDDPLYGPSSRRKPEAEGRPQSERPQTLQDLAALAIRYKAIPPGALDDVFNDVVQGESNAPSGVVSLGVEIEVFDEQLMRENPTGTPSQIERRVGEFFERCRLVEQAGIPAGRDGLWEFSLQPAAYYPTLAYEVALLRRMGLLDTDNYEYPLHFHIANISIDGADGLQAQLFARLIEATGWSTSPKRYRLGESDRTNNWGSPNDAAMGMRVEKRRSIFGNPGEDAAENDVMVDVLELRALCLRSLVGFTRTLRSAYALGSALAAYQRKVKNLPITAVQAQILGLWEELSSKASRFFKGYDFDDPAEHKWMTRYSPKTHTRRRLDRNFRRMAELLEQAEKPSTKGSKFVEEAQDLVGEYTERIMAILHPTTRNAQNPIGAQTNT